MNALLNAITAFQYTVKYLNFNFSAKANYLSPIDQKAEV